MDENHQDKTENKAPVTKDQKRLKHLQEKSLAERMGFSGKTGWDWLHLLILFIGAIAVPLSIIVGLYTFTAQQKADNLRTQQQDMDNARLAADQQQEMTLQTYLNDITTLLFDDKLRGQAPTSAEAAVIARSKTIIALSRLTDPQRKAAVVHFLYESHLIGYYDYSPIVNIADADLRGAFLIDAKLIGADLRSTDLRGADLSDAKLSDAKLRGADLSDAKLSEADLYRADLFEANLSKADLSGANLSKADLSGANLSKADLRGAKVTQAQLDESESLQGTIIPDGLEGHPPTPTSAQQATIVVQHFYDDINNRDYQAAYSLLGSKFQGSLPYDKFLSEFAYTEYDDLTIGTVTAFSDGTFKVPATIVATEDNVPGPGTHQSTYQGYYIVGPENGTLKILSGYLPKVG